MAAIENEEEEVALVEDNNLNNDINGNDGIEVEEVEGLDRSTEATNDEFINFIVPDCLSQHENSKSCFFDNNGGSSISSKDKNSEEEEEFFTPILPPEIEATVAVAAVTSGKRTTPSPPSLLSKIFPTLSTTSSKNSESHSSKNSKSCATGTITIKSNGWANVEPKTKSVKPTPSQLKVVKPTTTPTITLPTTLATKPSIEAFPVSSNFTFLHASGTAVTTPGAYPIFLTSTFSPLLSPLSQPSVTTTSLPMGQIIKIDDFPRTSIILTASGVVILGIALIVFYVFYCRQTPPIDLKIATTAAATAIPNGNGYTPIPIDTFREPRNPSSQICPANGVIVSRPVQAAVIPGQNQNFDQTPPENDFFKKASTMNNNNNNNINGINGISISANGHHQKINDKRRSDYKEWYV